MKETTKKLNQRIWSYNTSIAFDDGETIELLNIIATTCHYYKKITKTRKHEKQFLTEIFHGIATIHENTESPTLTIKLEDKT